MPGVDDSFPGKGQNFFMDAGEKQVAITARKVPPADAIGKEDISPEKLVCRRKIQTKASRAVAGHEKKFNAVPSRWNRAGLLQELGGADGTKALGKAEGEHGVRF